MNIRHSGPFAYGQSGVCLCRTLFKSFGCITFDDMATFVCFSRSSRRGM